jgi:hypothetical protein
VRGASDATYLINSFNEELLMQLQLNVHRLVVYRVPALDALDADTLAVRLGVGALAQSTPDGNSAGVMPRLQVILADAT